MFQFDKQLRATPARVNLLAVSNQCELFRLEKRNWPQCKNIGVRYACFAQSLFAAQTNKPFKSSNKIAEQAEYSHNQILDVADFSSTPVGAKLQRGDDSKDFPEHNQAKNIKRESLIQKDSRRVMCLMSDTGGGHRASAQALKDGFELIFGDEFSISIVDLWSTHSPWPFSNMPKSYFFSGKESVAMEIKFPLFRT
jgi:hypothetical protein